MKIYVPITLLILMFLCCGPTETEVARKIDEVDDTEQQAVEEVEEAEALPAPEQSDSADELPQDNPSPEEQSEEPAQNVPPTEEPTPPPTNQVFEVGDIIEIGDNTLIVLGWEEVPPSDFSQPDPGKKFVGVEAVIVNSSSSPASISSMLQMSLKDSENRKYDTDFLAATAMDTSSLDGELSPGERMRGKVGFQIPENAQGLQFVFDASVFGTGKVVVNLGGQPVKVEPPAEIAGETAQEVYQLGERVETGNFAIIVNGVSSPPGDDFSQPDPGKKFLVVDVTVENRTNEAKTVSTMLQMWLKDAAGQKYTIDFMASTVTDGSSPEGELSPGEKIRGPVGFQVPVEATGLVFVFDASVFGHGKVSVSLVE